MSLKPRMPAATSASASRCAGCGWTSASVGVPLVKHIYAQVIDDAKGVTLARLDARKTMAKRQYRRQHRCGQAVGKLLAERA